MTQRLTQVAPGLYTAGGPPRYQGKHRATVFAKLARQYAGSVIAILAAAYVLVSTRDFVALLIAGTVFLIAMMTLFLTAMKNVAFEFRHDDQLRGYANYGTDESDSGGVDEPGL